MNSIFCSNGSWFENWKMINRKMRWLFESWTAIQIEIGNRWIINPDGKCINLIMISSKVGYLLVTNWIGIDYKIALELAKRWEFNSNWISGWSRFLTSQSSFIATAPTHLPKFGLWRRWSECGVIWWTGLDFLVSHK